MSESLFNFINHKVSYPVICLGIPVLWKAVYKQFLDVFKQAKVADTGMHKIFNLTFVSVQVMLFCTSFSLIWALVWVLKLVYRRLKPSGYASLRLRIISGNYEEKTGQNQYF